MGSSYPLVAVGVGVLVALAQTTAGYSQEPDFNPSAATNEQSPANHTPKKTPKKLTSHPSVKALCSQIERSQVQPSQSDRLKNRR